MRFRYFSPRFWWRVHRRRSAEKQSQNQPIHVIQEPIKDPYALRGALREHPEGVLFLMEDPQAFGFDPVELDRREKSVEEGNFISADEFFGPSGIRCVNDAI